MTDLPSERDLDRLPTSAWVLGWTCLLAQVLALAERGVSRSDPFWVVLSMVLGALVVGWVSSGVLCARTGRLIVAWLVFGAGPATDVVGVASPAPMQFRIGL